MFISRLNDIIDPKGQRKHTGGINSTSRLFRRTRISYNRVEVLAGLVEFAHITIAISAGGILFQKLMFGNHSATGTWFGTGVIIGILHVYAASTRGLYRFPALITPRLHMGRLLTTWALAALLVTWGLLFLKSSLELSPWPLAAVLLTQSILLLTGRSAYAKAARALLSAGCLDGRRIVILGEPSELLRLHSEYLLQHYGFQVVARVAVGLDSGGRSGEVNPDLGCALAAADEHGAEEFLLAPRWDSPRLLDIVRGSLRVSPLPVRLLPDHSIKAVLEKDDLAPEGLIVPVRLQRAPLSTFEKAAKRVLDILISMIALMILWPIVLMAAIAIKIESDGPVIFRQRRTGINAKEFVIFKFRTMKVLEDGRDIVQACKGDSRVTAAGKFLRRTSIDELPQLINVLKGDMSLVGPRPHAIAHDKHYKALIAEYGFRFHVKPGLTGWAQVNGLRGETASVQQMAERVKFDLWYINNWSIGLDLSILARTCIEVFRDEAY